MRHWSFAALAALSCASLSANAALLLARRAPLAPAVVAPPAPRASTDEPPRAPTDADALARCEASLDRCRDQGWELAQRLILESGGAGAPRAQPRDAGAVHDFGLEDQRAALCKKATTSLFETWHNDRDNVVSGLTKSLADADEQQKNAASVAGEMSGLIGLGRDQADALAADYAALRLARVSAAREALAGDPPDVAALIDGARGLFADEDALIQQYGGADARLRWRSGAGEGRTVILALANSIAGKSPEEALGF